MKFDRHQALIRLALAFFLLMSGHLQAQDKKVILTPWTTDDIINQETAYDFNLSPDGQKVVWVKSIPDKEKDTRLSHLFLSLTGKEQTGQSIQLTRGNKSRKPAALVPQRSVNCLYFRASRRGGRSAS